MLCGDSCLIVVVGGVFWGILSGCLVVVIVECG